MIAVLKFGTGSLPKIPPFGEPAGRVRALRIDELPLGVSPPTRVASPLHA